MSDEHTLLQTALMECLEDEPASSTDCSVAAGAMMTLEVDLERAPPPMLRALAKMVDALNTLEGSADLTGLAAEIQFAIGAAERGAMPSRKAD